MIESRPINVTFNAKKNVTGLKIITGLNTADELRDAAIQVVAGMFRLPLVHAPPKFAPT